MILTFHRVRPCPSGAYAPNRHLEITPEFLDRVLCLLASTGFEVVPLDQVPARLSGSGAPFAALTFDDGYRDNLTYARPVLRRHKAPWTMFVTTDFAAGRGRMWWVELERALDLLRDTPEEKAAAFDLLMGQLRNETPERLLATVGALAGDAGVDSGALVRELCLGWDEIAELADDPDVTIGAHTVTHPILANAAASDVAAELAQSKAELERRLGRPVDHLAYPVGDPASAGDREFVAARDAGFRTAVTTRPGHLFPVHLTQLHALPRVSANGRFQSDAAVRALLSGVPFLARPRRRISSVSCG